MKIQLTVWLFALSAAGFAGTVSLYDGVTNNYVDANTTISNPGELRDGGTSYHRYVDADSAVSGTQYFSLTGGFSGGNSPVLFGGAAWCDNNLSGNTNSYQTTVLSLRDNINGADTLRFYVATDGSGITPDEAFGVILISVPDPEATQTAVSGIRINGNLGTEPSLNATFRWAVDDYGALYVSSNTFSFGTTPGTRSLTNLSDTTWAKWSPVGGETWAPTGSAADLKFSSSSPVFSNVTFRYITKAGFVYELSDSSNNYNTWGELRTLEADTVFSTNTEPVFVPAIAGGAALHLDASDVSSVETISGTNVVRGWGNGSPRVFRDPLSGEDVSGYPYNPRLVQGALTMGTNSRSAIYFDGVNDSLSLTADIVLDKGSYELFAVAWAPEASLGSMLVSFSGTYIPTDIPVLKTAGLSVGVDPTNFKLYPFEPLVFHVWGDLAISTDFPLLDFTIRTNFMTATRSYQSRIGGDSRNVATNSALPNGKDFRGYLGEILLYKRALTDTERSNTVRVLSEKWGIDAANDNPVRHQETGLENPSVAMKAKAAAAAAIRTNGMPLHVGLAAASGFNAASPENARTPPKYGQKYLDRMWEDFDAFVLANNLKIERLWFKNSTTNYWDFSTADTEVAEILNAAAAHGESYLFRGHTLIWKKANPDWLVGELASNQISRMQAMDLHITQVLGHFATHSDTRFRAAVSAWDLVNEPFTPAASTSLFDPYDLNYDPGNPTNSYDQLFSQAGDGLNYENPWFAPISSGEYRWVIGSTTQKVDYVEYAFRKADAVLSVLYAGDPQNRPDLFVNEFGMETEPTKWNATITLIKYWLRRGVPIDGVGFQCHIGMFGFDQIEFARRLDELKALGLKVHITELDVAMPYPRTNRKMELQKEVYRKLVEVAASRDNVEAIVTWGLTDSISDAGTSVGWMTPEGANPSLYFTEVVADGAVNVEAESYLPKPAYFGVREALHAVAAGRADTDNDGMSDSYERAAALDPFDAADAAVDTDGDGLSNLAEYIAGTSPAQSNDYFRITKSGTIGAGLFEVTAPGLAGRVYSLQGRGSLLAGSWLPITNSAVLGNNQNVLLRHTSEAATNFFYRIQVEYP